MKTLYFDCFSGISGDMAVGALLDLGVPDEIVRQALDVLPLDGAKVSWEKIGKNGIAATRFTVTDSGEVHHVHRTLSDIEVLLGVAELPPDVRASALRIFRVVAEAEGKIHGIPVERVHFHEVGAIDSLVDIVVAAQCIRWLVPGRVVFSPLREGRGTVSCAHGVLPIPAPATLAILATCGAPVEFTDTTSEMVTPTGAGLVAALGDDYGAPCPSGRVLAVGYGAGYRDFEHPNVLRAVLMETADAVAADATAGNDAICVLEAAMDDCDGETLGNALEVLQKSGIPECFLTPVTMKKGRPGFLLTVLCPCERENEAVELIFRHTTTIGMRRGVSERHVMAREVATAHTPYGDIPVKVSRWGGVMKAKPEFASLRDSAEKAGAPAEAVRRAALAALAALAASD